jgi:hypothetical protein
MFNIYIYIKEGTTTHSSKLKVFLKRRSSKIFSFDERVVVPLLDMWPWFFF